MTQESKTVHQIWLGGPLPEREAAWVARVRAAATAAGWVHKLWREAELEAAFCGEPMHELMKAGLRLVPHPTSYTFAADWYKLRIMASEPGLYLDTDFVLQGSEWPDLPDAADVYAQEESGARGQGRVNACIYWARTARPFALACRVGEANILRQLHPYAPDFELQWVNFIRGDAGWSSGVLSPHALAGAFLRRHVLPRWRKAGISWAAFPPAVVGHAKWEQKGILTHMGAGSWLWGAGLARDGAFWDARAAQAAEHVRQAAIAKLPAHLRPSAGCIVPPRRVAARVEHRRAAAPIAPGAPFRIPAEVERVVVLSNVEQGFPWRELQLKSTDLVIHCNHAKHRAHAMQVQGSRHWLFVRHGRGGDPRGWHWYHPTNMDGFEKVFFVDDTQLLTPCRWMADFRRLSRKSPTTGFLVANLVREYAPELPLVLAGFDPGVNHGTPQWDGHDWAAERTWYRQRGFVLLKPQANYD